MTKKPAPRRKALKLSPPADDTFWPEGPPKLPLETPDAPIGVVPHSLIDKPGVYPSIPLDEYHRQLTVGFSTSHSALELIFQASPLHFWDRCYLNPDRDILKPSDAMTLGRAAHHLFLGERQFQKHFIRRPSNAPDGRNWHASNNTCIDWMRREPKGRDVLTPEMVDKIARMKVALEREPLIQAGLLAGKIEQSYVWQDAETGIWLKARPDAVPNDGDFADLKIVADISEEGIRRSINRFGYHRQGAMILEGHAKTTGAPLAFRGPGEGEENGMSFSLVFVESVRPHAVEIVTLRPSDLKRGLDETHASLKVLKRCLDANHWPGPSGEQRDARYLGLSDWDIRDNDYRMSQIKKFLALPAPSTVEGFG